jgi:hypothetical protein
MAEPENHDFPDAVGVISDAYDTAQDGLRAAAMVQVLYLNTQN